MPSRRIPFALLLPLFSLTLFAILVAIPATLNYLRLQQSSQDPTQINPRQLLSPKETFLSIASSEPESFANLLNGIDVPANFMELPFDRLSHS